MSEVKNQHYISQRILEKFANNKNQVVEALVNEDKVYSTNYRQSMSEKYIYEHPALEVNELEKFFGEIEGYFSPALNEFLSLIEQYENKSILLDKVKVQIEKYMKEFIIFYYRSGALLHEFSSFDKTDNKFHKIVLLLDNILNSNYIKELSHTITNHYDFYLLKSEDSSFLLSDQYISSASLSVKGRYLNVSNRNLGMKDVLILIPLSSNYYIAYTNGNNPHYFRTNTLNVLTEEQVIEINNCIINNSYVKCIGKNKACVEEALKNFDIQSPVGTVASYKSGGQSIAKIKKEVFFYEKDKELWDFFVGHNYTDFLVSNTKVKLERNDDCLCNSGKKFKRCCMDNVYKSIEILDNMHNNRSNKVRIKSNLRIEKAISELFIESQ